MDIKSDIVKEKAAYQYPTKVGTASMTMTQMKVATIDPHMAA